MPDRVTFDEVPSWLERKRWCEWLRQHTVDPSDVATPGWIERHEDTRRIAYEAYAVDESGLIRINPTDRGAVRETHVVQLEARPLPFPAQLSDTKDTPPDA